MRIGSFEFSLRELAGSMGDFGTLRVKDIIPAGVTAGVSLIWNMALGFVAGFLVYFVIKYYFRATGKCKSCSSLFELTPDSKM